MKASATGAITATPASVVRRLQDELLKALQLPQTAVEIERQGLEVSGKGAAEFATKELAGVDQARVDHPIAQNVLLMVDVLKEQVHGRDPLGQSLLDPRPFACTMANHAAPAGSLFAASAPLREKKSPGGRKTSCQPATQQIN